MPSKSVALAGLGAIGSVIAKGFARGIPGLELVAVADANRSKAEALAAAFPNRLSVVELKDLCQADIVVEALPSSAFDEVAAPVIEAGKTLVPCSVGALLSRGALFEQAARTGARIMVPTGAIAGLDAVRAMARSQIHQIRLESRKPPKGLIGAPYLAEHNMSLADIAQPLLVFDGNAAEACRHFPANANVAAALALAGIGPSLTRVQIWADPAIDRNIHSIHVDSESARITIVVENIPSEDNPRTSKLAPLSILACLAGLVSPVRIGS